MKIINKTILILTGLVFLIVLTIIVALKFFEDEIYKIVLVQINKNINTEISSRKTTLSLFQYFPNAALTLYNVKININRKFSLSKIDTFGDHNFITANQLIIKFSLFSLLKNPVIIRGLEINTGKISILENFYNINNYQLTTNLSKNRNSLIFQVQNIRMQNISFRYLNEKNDFYINTYFKKLYIHGKILNNYTNISINASFHHFLICSKNSKYFTKNISEFSLIFTSKPEIIILNDGLLSFNNELIKFSGTYSLLHVNKYNFTFQINKFLLANISDFGFIFPKEITFPKGNFSIYLNCFGNNLKNSPICFQALLLTYNISCTYTKYKINNLHINLIVKGSYLNSLKATYQAKEIRGEILNSDFRLTNIKYETSNDSLTGNGLIIAKCSDLKKLFKDNLIRISDGKIKLSFLLKSLIDKNTKVNLLKLIKNPNLSIFGLKCSLFNDKYLIRDLNSEIFSVDKNLKFSFLHGSINNNDINLSGTLFNYQSIFNETYPKIEFNGAANSKFVNLNDIITTNIYENNDSLFKRRFPVFSVELSINFDSLIYKNFIFSHYHSVFHYSNETYFINNVNTFFCGGKIFDGNIKIHTDSNFLSLITNCNFKSIDIETVFFRFSNFGQNEITSQNIKGKLNGNADCKISWKNNVLVQDDFLGNISFELVNGQLDGFQPIYKLSKFVELSELNSIKFKKLTNRISFSNRMVNIPTMILDNSALNLSLSGSHSFKNEYEYHFKVILSNLLFNNQVYKLKKKKDNFQTEKDTLRTFYLKLVGNNTSYKFTYDGTMALKEFSDKIQNEKKQFKKIFNEEFGLTKNDSSIGKNLYKLKNNPIVESEDLKSDENLKDIDKKKKKEKKKNNIEWKDE